MIVNKSFFEEIEMDLTGVCNLACPLCTRNYAHAEHMLKKNIRPIDEITTQLDEFPNLKRFFIAGAVSEPTMYKDFIKFIEYLNGRGIQYELFTNGNTRTPDWWQMLGEIVPAHCMTAFTVCGSTQELHEKYRVNSSLQQILDNAAAYRKNGRHNDWIQHIRFEYNAEDLDSGAMQPIFDQFSNVMCVETEGIRRLNDYRDKFPVNIKPLDTRDRLIRELFRNRPRPNDGKTYCIQCKSLDNKKLHIDQFGQISACYIHAEFEHDYFTGDEFDYSDIVDFRYPDCFLCEKRTKTFIDKMGLDFVC